MTCQWHLKDKLFFFIPPPLKSSLMPYLKSEEGISLFQIPALHIFIHICVNT